MTKKTTPKKIYYFKEKFAEAGDVTLRYTDIGKGKPIVFIHSFAGNHQHWIFTVRALRRHFRVLMIDLPGYGESSKDAAHPYDMPFFSRSIVAFLKKLGIKKATLVGSSLGGHIALHTAIHYPERVEKLVLVDAAGLMLIPPALKRAAKAVVKNFGPFLFLYRPGPAMIRLAVDYTFFFPSAKSQSLAADVDAFFRASDYHAWSKVLYKTVYGVIEDDSRNKLRELSCPVLCVWGLHDRLLPFWDAVVLKAVVPHSHLVLLRKCGHFPHLEQTLKFNKILRGFLHDDGYDVKPFMIL